MITATQVQSWNKSLSGFPIVVQVAANAGLSPVSLVAVGVLGGIAAMLIMLNLWTAVIW